MIQLAKTFSKAWWLTTGIDTLTGGASNDVFTATVNSTGTLSTLNLGDTINGGAGTDTLNVIANVDGALAGTTKSVEVININQASGVAAATLIASSQAADATNINSTGAGSVTVTGLGAAQQVGMSGATAGNNAAAFTVTQTTNGPLTLNLNGAVGSATAGNLTFVDAGAATTATINATGTASTLQGVILPGATALTVNAGVNVALGNVNDTVLATVVASGAATSVNLGTLNSTVVSSINASGLTAGGLTATLADNNLSTVTFVGGAGNDTLNLGTNVLAGAAGQLNAGAGTGDTLGLTLATQLTAALAPAYVGFETLSLNAATDQTFNIATLAGITGVTVGGGTAVTTVNGLTALAPQTVTSTGTHGLILGVTGATAVGTLDTANVVLSSGATLNAASTLTQLSVAGVETLNLTAATGTGVASVSALTNGASLTAINLLGDSPISFTTVGAIGSNLTVTATGSGVHTIDFSGATGNAVSISSGSGNDRLTGTGLNDIIKAGAGNDVLIGGAGADTLTGGAGNDTFAFATAANTKGAFAGIDTNAANIDKITDFVGNGAAAGDTIQLGVTADAFGAGITFSATTTANVTAVTVATAADFTALAAAIQAGITGGAGGVVSTNGAAQVYDVTVTAGNLAGHYAVVNDATTTITVADTFIAITGAAALHQQDFAFA